MIDAGLSGSRIENAVSEIDGMQNIKGILITHEHSDHIKGTGILARKHYIPIYANEKTWNAICGKIGEIPRELHRVFDTGEDFYLGGIGIHPFSIPHDAAEPVGFRLWAQSVSVSIATDMGYVKKSVLHEIAGSQLCLIESNHDPKMLMENPRYSRSLKERILGRYGHLCNDACAKALPQMLESGIGHVILGHLSAENNTPELAMQTAVNTLKQEGIIPGEEMTVDIAWRDHRTAIYRVGVRHCE